MCSHAQLNKWNQMRLAQKNSTANQITGWVGRSLALVEKALGGLTKRQRKPVHFPTIASVSFCLSLFGRVVMPNSYLDMQGHRDKREMRCLLFTCHEIITEASDTLKTFHLTNSACQSTQLWRSNTPLSPSLTCSLTLSLLKRGIGTSVLFHSHSGERIDPRGRPNSEVLQDLSFH